MLLAELTRSLGDPKLRKRIPPEKAAAYAAWVRDHGRPAEDPTSPPPVGPRDPDEDYLLALAISERAYLVTGLNGQDSSAARAWETAPRRQTDHAPCP